MGKKKNLGAQGTGKQQPTSTPASVAAIPDGKIDCAACCHSKHKNDCLSSLVARLTAVPEGLCCSISLSIIEDPVVAEDGFTYERKEIEHALSIRQLSPTTNMAMGQHLLQNHNIKSLIVEYKEQTVAEIIRVVPHVPNSEAAKLLKRAEEFIRPRLPDSGARAQIFQLLQLRMELPAALHGDAVKEFLRMAVDSKEDVLLAELLRRFESLNIASMLGALDEDVVRQLHTVARVNSLLENEGKDALSQELAHRLAKHTSDADGIQELWQLIMYLSDATKPCVWTEGAGLVMAAFFSTLQVNLPVITNDVLEHTLLYMENPCMAASKARKLFNSSLGLETDTNQIRHPPDLAKVLLEMAGRQEDGQSTRKQLLLRARAVDVENATLRLQLIQILSEGLDLDKGHDHEGLLLTMLFEEANMLPEHLLPKLQLESAQMVQIKPVLLLQFAEQLACATRSFDGACIAVVAARQYEAANEKEFAQQAYVRAYGMDRSNKDAFFCGHGHLHSQVHPARSPKFGTGTAVEAHYRRICSHKHKA